MANAEELLQASAAALAPLPAAPLPAALALHRPVNITNRGSGSRCDFRRGALQYGGDALLLVG